MNLIDLEAFVSVVDRGSIVAAAAGLHLTQSAVTRRIQNLEDALGTPLLDRQTRPLQPLAPDRKRTERLSDESRIGVHTVGQDR